MRGKALVIISAIGAALALTGCPGQNAPQGSYGSVAGVVSSSAGPIAGASVCIFVVECVTTAADGSYKLSTVPADPAGINETITASAANYTSASQQVHIAIGQQTPANFTLVHT
jgi:hypothetical protein